MYKLGLLTLLLSTSCLFAEDRIIKNREGSCQVSVPSDWVPSSIIGFANSPDKKSTIALTYNKSADSFADLKRTVQQIYTGSKVTKDSATEFEMEGKSPMNGKPNVYRGIPVNGHFCIAELTYESGTAADAKKIIETMKAAK